VIGRSPAAVAAGPPASEHRRSPRLGLGSRDQAFLVTGRKGLLGQQPDCLELLQEIFIQILALQGGFAESEDGRNWRPIPVLVRIDVRHV
jgi:hypothetical protein